MSQAAEWVRQWNDLEQFSREEQARLLKLAPVLKIGDRTIATVDARGPGKIPAVVFSTDAVSLEDADALWRWLRDVTGDTEDVEPTTTQPGAEVPGIITEKR